MSDFAKAQLLKYGWTEGKGLGKNENGIAEALKPKLKFDTSGIGHKDVDFQWWDCIYDRALKNIVLDKKEDQVSIKVAKENAFNISSSQSGLEVSKKQHSLQYGKFLKMSTLKDGNMIKDSTCEVIEDNTKDILPVIKMSDEELFNACGGRTAHKGARHGLTLNGKLARIAEQERQLLAAQYLKSNEESSQVVQKKKKKKKKRMKIGDCTSMPKDEDTLNTEDSTIPDSQEQIKQDYRTSKKTRKKVKRKIHTLTRQLTKSCMIQDDLNEDSEEKSSDRKRNEEILKIEKMHRCRKIKSKRKRDQEDIDNNASDTQLDEDVPIEPCIKKLRKITIDSPESMLDPNNEVSNCVQDTDIETVKGNSKHKKDKIHCSSKEHKYSYCTKTEADRLNAKIKLKKRKKIQRKESKKLEKLSDSLAVNLNLNSTEQNIKKKLKSSKKHKKKTE